jgi:hypothetical protein
MQLKADAAAAVIKNETAFSRFAIPVAEAETLPEPTEATVAFPYRQLSVFVRRYETGGPLERVPLYAVAEIALLEPQAANDGGRDVERLILAGLPISARQLASLTYSLGLLATDHVGYASFDLAPLTNDSVVARLGQIAAAWGRQPVRTPLLALTRLTLLPFLDETLAIDCLNAGEAGVEAVVVRVELDDAQLTDRDLDKPLASMQSPNLTDWRLSPGSFSISGVLLVGEDACETLIPANLAAEIFRFRQAVRLEINGLSFPSPATIT